MPDDTEDELPWNEERWERLLQQSEARSARYGDLLETLMDHPDRDDIIDREMGWDRDDDEPINPEVQECIDELNEIASQPLDDEELEAMEEERDKELDAIPGYRAAFDYGLRMHHLLVPLMESKDEDLAEDAGEAHINGHIIAAKLAGAHGMGYEDDALCGNICVCKRSLAAANECLAALERLRERKALPDDVLNSLVEEGKVIRGLVEGHIAELRSRVWWD